MLLIPVISRTVAKNFTVTVAKISHLTADLGTKGLKHFHSDTTLRESTGVLHEWISS